jgi:hypothetical protein
MLVYHETNQQRDNTYGCVPQNTPWQEAQGTQSFHKTPPAVDGKRQGLLPFLRSGRCCTFGWIAVAVGEDLHTKHACCHVHGQGHASKGQDHLHTCMSALAGHVSCTESITAIDEGDDLRI